METEKRVLAQNEIILAKTALFTVAVSVLAGLADFKTVFVEPHGSDGFSCSVRRWCGLTVKWQSKAVTGAVKSPDALLLPVMRCRTAGRKTSL